MVESRLGNMAKTVRVCMNVVQSPERCKLCVFKLEEYDATVFHALPGTFIDFDYRISTAALDACTDWELAELLSHFDAFSNVVQQPEQTSSSQSCSSAVANNSINGSDDHLWGTILAELTFPTHAADSQMLCTSSTTRYEPGLE